MDNVTNLILTTLERSNKEWTPKSHYPSSASFKYKDGTVVGPDIASQFLKWRGVAPSNPPDGRGIMIMRLGEGTHDQLGKILLNSGLKVMTEVSFKIVVPTLKYQVSGRADELLEMVQGELECLEVKSSTDDKMFGTKWIPGICDTGPKEDHLLQMICYFNGVPGLKRGRFLYQARDTGRMLEFVMERSGDSYAIDGKPVNELSWAGIVKRWEELESAVFSGIAPKPDYPAWINESTGEVMKIKTIDGVQHKSHWRTMYDNYRDAIWKDQSNFKYSMNATFQGGHNG